MGSKLKNPRRALLATAIFALAALAGGGVAGADPSLKDQIDSAQKHAGQLGDQIDAQTARIASLTERARQAGAQAMVAAAQLESTQKRSEQLEAQLQRAQRELDRVRAEYNAALKQLEGRLVAIYKSDLPDATTVVLNSDGFDDLATRQDYLDALHDADQRMAERVASLRDQVAERVQQVTDLKEESDAEAARLADERASLRASQGSANSAAAEAAKARVGTQASLSDVQGQVDDLEQQQAEQQGGSGNPAFLGGPYAIPTYIVMCESGGNYRALNPSSGAGGAYQILPSTWRAYGGQGEPQNAPKAEQDRIAAEIWRDSGPSAWACA